MFSSTTTASSSGKSASAASGSGFGASQTSPAPVLTTDESLYWAVPTMVPAFNSTCRAHGYHVCVDCALAHGGASSQSSSNVRK
jgi:hypothetical protein